MAETVTEKKSEGTSEREQRKPIKAAPEVPDWVEQTPGECRYTLVMFGTDGDGIQEIDMSRSEFEILKEQLAAHRGHSVR